MKLLIAMLIVAPFILNASTEDGCSGITYTTGATNKSGPCYDTSGSTGACSSTSHYTAFCYTATMTYTTSALMGITGYGEAGKFPKGCDFPFGTCVGYARCPNTIIPITEQDPSNINRWLFKAYTWDQQLTSSVLHPLPACLTVSAGYHEVTWFCGKHACSCTCGGSCICQSDGTCRCTPIVVDPSGNFAMTDMAHGVRFVVNSGEPSRQMSWPDPKGGAGWLVLPDVNGEVKSFQDMFADYNKLGVFDLESEGGNGNSEIDSGDTIYSRLRVWIDSNQDGISQPSELHTLDSLGIGSIGLKVHYSEKRDRLGNWFRFEADDKKSCDVLVHAEALSKVK